MSEADIRLDIRTEGVARLRAQMVQLYRSISAACETMIIFGEAHARRVWPEAYQLLVMEWPWPTFAVRYRPYDHEHDGA